MARQILHPAGVPEVPQKSTPKPGCPIVLGNRRVVHSPHVVVTITSTRSYVKWRRKAGGGEEEEERCDNLQEIHSGAVESRPLEVLWSLARKSVDQQATGVSCPGELFTATPHVLCVDITV